MIARRLLLILCCLAFGIANARADYPDRPIRILVGFAPGGPTDILARIIGQWLTDRFGQQVVIENKPGAGGNIATEAAVNAPADGYTLLVLATANAINATYYRKLPYDFLRDITGVAGLARVPSIMEVNPGVPVKTVAELIAYVKANPGKVNVASGGSGTTAHLAIELLKSQAQIDLVHGPYRGLAPALTDLISGQVQMMFGDILSSLPHVKSGALRPLAVTTAQRTAVLPDVPTVAETFPGFEASAWFGIGAPAGTPAAIVERLNMEINAGLNDPKVNARILELGATPLVMVVPDYARFLSSETEKWAGAVRSAGASADQ
ncbi:MAG: tripartite tricarboxylate transporter substrate binding protein [Xanthobacteraceae bacterium]